MKRAFFIFFLFGVFTAGAFAQITFGATAYVGIQVESPFSDTHTSETVSATHRREGPSNIDFFMVGTRDNMGFRLDLNYQIAAEDPVRLDGLYGWTNLFDNSLNLAFGRISNGRWVSVLDADHKMTFDEITGFRVAYDVRLLPGLNVGVAFPAEGLTDEEYDLEKFFRRVVFGASYVHPLFTAVFAYDLGSNTRMLFGLNLAGFGSLTSAGIQMVVSNMATWDNRILTGQIQLRERVEFRITREFSVALLASQTFFGHPDRDTALLFNLTASYRFNHIITAFLSGEISSPDYFETNTYKIRPSLEFAMGGAGFLYVEYELELGRYRMDSFHRFGIGLNIRIF